MENEKTGQEEKNGGLSEKDALNAAHSSFQKLIKVSTFLRENDLTGFLAYRYNRIGVWAELDSLPESKDQTTEIRPPESQVVKGFADMKNDGKWETIINITEKLLPKFKFWLDLNLLTAESLNMLGIRYQKAAEVVHQETVFLVHRLPGIERLKYADGTPFASEPTKSWLKKHELLCTPPKAFVDESLADDIETVQKIAKNLRLVEAIEFIQNKLSATYSRPERFAWRIELCKILIGFRQRELVVSHLEKLFSNIEDYGLEEWDPALALKGLEIIWEGYKMTDDDKYLPKIEDALQRISKIDPVAAYNLIKVKN